MKDLDEDTKHVRLSPQVYSPVVNFITFLFVYFTRLFLYLWSLL